MIIPRSGLLPFQTCCRDKAEVFAVSLTWQLRVQQQVTAFLSQSGTDEGSPLSCCQQLGCGARTIYTA